MRMIFGAFLIGACCLTMAGNFSGLERSIPILNQIFLPLLGAGGGPPCPSQLISLVQQNNAVQSNCTACVVTVPGAPASGDMLALVANSVRNTPAATVTSVASTNTTWTQDGAAQIVQSTVSGDLEIWHGLVSGVGGTSVTITYNNALGTSGLVWSLSEWSGTPTSSPADGTAG